MFHPCVRLFLEVVVVIIIFIVVFLVCPVVGRHFLAPLKVQSVCLSQSFANTAARGASCLLSLRRIVLHRPFRSCRQTTRIEACTIGVRQRHFATGLCPGDVGAMLILDAEQRPEASSAHLRQAHYKAHNATVREILCEDRVEYVVES